MGKNKENQRDVIIKQEEEEDVAAVKRACISWLWSFSVSLTGGLILGVWEYEYHPTYRQLWMVPLGLILFLTPLIVWFAVFVSDLCLLLDDHDEKLVWRARSDQSSVAPLDDDSVHRDPET